MNGIVKFFFAVLFLPAMLSGDTVGRYCGINGAFNRPELLRQAPEQLKFMNSSGISWMRMDFYWWRVERKIGQFNFHVEDQSVTLAKNAGMQILPILCYNHPDPNLYPAWKDIDGRWSNYVRTLVARYRKDLPYWEVYNEPNVDRYWGMPVKKDSKANATEYTAMLKNTWQVIKSVDPELKVLYGGTSGVPLGFIEESFRAGAGNWFDVMSVHPYYFHGTPESAIIPRMRQLYTLMAKYNIRKPIWFTELGWSTAQTCFAEILPVVLKRAGVEPAQTRAALICHASPIFNGNGDAPFAPFREVKWISPEQLESLEPKKFGVVIASGNECFPVKYLPALRNYVARGGTLFLAGGLPFYYDLEQKENGDFVRKTVSDHHIAKFHIGYDVWWKKEGLPRKDTFAVPGKEFAGKITVNKEFLSSGGGYLNAENLKPGDEFIPVIESGDGDFKAPTIALYKLNSDLKGNIIVSIGKTKIQMWTEKTQAEFLPRAFLVSLACGVERIFWYNYRSDERGKTEREGHFGIVSKNFHPKPAAESLKTFTRLCPPGSSRPVLKNNGLLYLASWIRPDGEKVWAYWTTFSRREVDVQIRGTVRDSFNHLGEKTEGAGNVATSSIRYIVGPKDISFKNIPLETVKVK